MKQQTEFYQLVGDVTLQVKTSRFDDDVLNWVAFTIIDPTKRKFEWQRMGVSENLGTKEPIWSFVAFGGVENGRMEHEICGLNVMCEAEKNGFYLVHFRGSEADRMLIEGSAITYDYGV